MTAKTLNQSYARAPHSGRLSTIADRSRHGMLLDITVIPVLAVALGLIGLLWF